MWPFRSSRRRRSITHFAHWELSSVDFGRLFHSLPSFLPKDSFLGLAGGVWSSELKEFFARHALHLNESLINALPREFQDAAFVPTTEQVMFALVDLVRRHAEPEIAVHLVAGQEADVLIEWYDAPNDPLALAGRYEEAAVARFAASIGASYCRTTPGV